MATAEQMAALADVLQTHTAALDKPVTEICIFKLKEPHTEETSAEFERNMIANTVNGKGIKRVAWGYSLDDPSTLVWMLDWVKIQYHWDFWQTPQFGPVMTTITNLFVEGRPLVRHYDFKPAGMLDQEFVRIFVWNEGELGRSEDEMVNTVTGAGSDDAGRAKVTKGAYAVDMGEMSWYCTMVGYGNETAARAAEVKPRGETHLLQLKHYENHNI